MKARVCLFLAAGLASLCSARFASAANLGTVNLDPGGSSVSLQDLLDGTQVTVDDKKFYGFTNFSSTALGTTATPLTATGIIVSKSVIAPAGEEGLKFQFAAIVSASQKLDTTFSYLVTSTIGNLITDNTLIVSGGATINGSWDVSETAQAGGPLGESLAAKHAVDLTFPVSTIVLSDHKVYTTPSPIVFISKDIFLDGGTGGTQFPNSSASISEVDQTFSQSIPLPSSAFMGVGLMAVIGLVRRFRAA